MNRITLYQLLCLLFFTYSCQETSLESTNYAEKIKEWKEHELFSGAYQLAEYQRKIRTEDGKEFPSYTSGYKYMEHIKAKNSRFRKTAREDLNWIERGPNNVGGRARGMWLDPSDISGNTLYVGSVGGGVYRTEDGGQSWTGISPDIANLSTTRIAGSASNPNILYAGTGEGYGPIDAITGSGIFKSTDRGETWNPIQSTFNRPTMGAINGLAVNPENPDHIIFAAIVNRRENVAQLRSVVAVSMDGGQTLDFTNTYETGEIDQLIVDPNDFNTVYISIARDGVYRSTNGGNTFSRIFVTDEFSRVEVTPTAMNTGIVYASAYRDDGTDDLYVSNESGRNFTLVKGQDAANNFDGFLGGQGWYDNAIGPHPTDPLKVFVAGAGLMYEITVNSAADGRDSIPAIVNPVLDGYGQVRDRFPGARSKSVHVDHHGILTKIDPNDPTNFFIYNTNDGGCAISKDGGETFIQSNDNFKRETVNGQTITYPTSRGMNTSQFYGADKANGIDRYVGGMQDNGSYFSQVDSDASTPWELASFGDGFEVAWNYADENSFITTSQFGRIVKTTDGGQTFHFATTPNCCGRDNFPFITRIANSKQEPGLLFTSFSGGLYRSDDFATVRRDLDPNNQNGNWDLIPMPSWWSQSAIPRISLATPDVVWAGTGIRNQGGNTQMAVSINQGRSFQEVARNTTLARGGITNIATHPFRDSTAFFIFSIGDHPKIIRTDDLGTTYRDITGFNGQSENSNNGFPDVATYSLVVMPYDENIMWAGTDIGIVETTDGGDTWHLADNGFPNTAVWDMRIVNDEVVVATHGRGVWSVSIPELEGYEPPAVPSVLSTQIVLDGNLSGTYTLRGPADNARILATYSIDGNKQTEVFDLMELNTVGEKVFFNFQLSELPEDEIVPMVVQIQSEVDGLTLSGNSDALLVNVDQDDKAIGYYYDFDNGEVDFATLNMEINNPSNFGSLGLGTPHPYANLSQYFSVFQKPIPITEENNTIAFDEIAIIEPGEDGIEFPDPNFWDYVLLRGTNDFGITWDTIQGYDCNLFQVWRDRWDSNSAANRDDIVRRGINLLDYYDIGDEVYLSWQVISDPFSNGWGWRIDDIQIGNSTVNTVDNGIEGISVKLINNPVVDQALIEVENTTESLDFDFLLYDINGKIVSKIEPLKRFSGKTQFSVDLSNFSAGTYILASQAGSNYRGTTKIVKI